MSDVFQAMADEIDEILDRYIENVNECESKNKKMRKLKYILIIKSPNEPTHIRTVLE